MNLQLRVTVRGKIGVDWFKGDTSFDLSVSVPAGMEADINIPKLGLSSLAITESGTTVWESNKYISGVGGLNGAEESADSVTFHAGSGSYNFALNGSLF
jgi:hypothetical protein